MQERFEDAIAILNGLRGEFGSVRNCHVALRVETHAATVTFRAKQAAEALESLSNIVAVFALGDLPAHFGRGCGKLDPCLQHFGTRQSEPVALAGFCLNCQT